MKLTTKGRYAVTAMLDLAIHHHEGPVTLSDISLAQSISLSYLEQLFAKLRNAGLVEGVRGPGGGYRLAKNPAKISVAEVIAAVDEQELFKLSKNRLEQDQGFDETADLWANLSTRLYEFLDTMKLDQFVEQRGIKEIASQQDEESRRMNFMMPPPIALS